MPESLRLDKELVRRGLARSRTQALKLIDAGAVTVGGAAVEKPATPVGPSADIAVAASAISDYVSRAAHKLIGALDAFAVEPRDKRCLDAGASTGGFTQVLLARGAREVAAVDVGHDQLVAELREDSRVQVFEGMNVRYLAAEDIGGRAELTVADLSFISLTMVVGALAAATEADGDLILMVKPQFEVGRERLASTGVVISETERKRAVTAVVRAALESRLAPRELALSPLPGQDGNLEYFLWLSQASQAPAESAEEFVRSHWPGNGQGIRP